MAVLTSKYTPEQRAKRQAATLAWRKRNPDKVKAYVSSDAIVAYKKGWAERNKHRILGYAAKWRSENREKSIESSLKWQSENPEAIRLIWNRKSAKRKAIKLNRLHPDHNFEIERAMYSKARELYKATGIRYDVDHVIPLSKGGWHHHDNLQVLDHNTNSSKHANPFWHKDGFKSFAEVCSSLWPTNLINMYNKILREEQQCLS